MGEIIGKVWRTSSEKTYTIMTIRTRTSSPGFWLPDEAIDSLIKAGPIGFGVYCLLGNADTGELYLAPHRLAELLRTSEEKVWSAVEVLYDEGAMNAYDVKMMQRAELTDPPPEGPAPVKAPPPDYGDEGAVYDADDVY